ncbi:MAG: DUF3368 domain-containing protein [Candidatus Bathyarchaeia archaeon]|nr:DUF3368 domain-containing protein [Candidatus Bathyarchaeota archaeon]
MIVSKATPLIYLAKIERISILRKLFGEVLVPQEVKVEVVDKGKQLGEGDAYIIEKAISDGWIKVLNVEPIETPIRLERGEVAALSIAKRLGIREVLVDETPARIAAKLMGLTARGTLYVLLKALEVEEIDLNEFLDSLSKLVEHGFRLKEEVYLEAVREARRISKV